MPPRFCHSRLLPGEHTVGCPSLCKLGLSSRQVARKVQGVDDIGTLVLDVVIPVHLHTVSFSLQAGPKWTGGESAQAAIPGA